MDLQATAAAMRAELGEVFCFLLKTSGAVVSGGWVLSRLMGEAWGGDLDIFIRHGSLGIDVLFHFLAQTTGQRPQRKGYYYMDGCLVHCFGNQVDVCVIPSKEPGPFIGDNFDIDVLKNWFDGERIHASFPDDLTNRVTRVRDPELLDPKTHLSIAEFENRKACRTRRIHKYEGRGLIIVNRDEIINAVNYKLCYQIEEQHEKQMAIDMRPALDAIYETEEMYHNACIERVRMLMRDLSIFNADVEARSLMDAEDEHGLPRGFLIETKKGVRRKIPADCAICLEKLGPDDELTWCRRSCGQNFHTSCLHGWIQSGSITCPVCRAKYLIFN